MKSLSNREREKKNFNRWEMFGNKKTKNSSQKCAAMLVRLLDHEKGEKFSIILGQIKLIVSFAEWESFSVEDNLETNFELIRGFWEFRVSTGKKVNSCTNFDGGIRLSPRVNEKMNE